ncbi:hypothetical protein FIE12Z_2218 [Fusarium flagelliforme]|uniref:Integral membrane protein n=1 Tax=Fusarium flagelliforme TaxID=2675880 RepID=A0A395N0V3_9HYPO|nr:hypothetical protein FIE12Z_2218 [Fusarium flagelliforme]
MYDNLLFRSNQVMALFPGLIGLNLLIRPEATLEQIKFTIPSEPQARKLTRGLARIYGIRNVVITFLFTNLCLTKDPGMVNLGYMGALAMCLTDGYVAKSVIGHGEWSHWVFAPVCVGAIAANYYFG